jgi:hypothetical protein
MRKTIIDNFRINDNVLITSFNPQLEGRIADMYETEPSMIGDPTLTRMYPKMVPIIEVILKDGKLRSFVKDVVKKA